MLHKPLYPRVLFIFVFEWTSSLHAAEVDTSTTPLLLTAFPSRLACGHSVLSVRLMILISVKVKLNSHFY